MKSKTSFFNWTVFRKDILRYSPIWAFYTLFLLLVLFGMTEHSRYDLARNAVECLPAMTWINLFYGGICGIVLFADLFNNRLCNAIHAFPLRREGWLTTHILSGLLFSLVPNLLFTGIGAFMLWEYAYLAPIWLAISTMQYLFFFGTAVLAATCAGNFLGTIAVYGITHFVTLFVSAIVQLLYQPLLYGVKINQKIFFHFFPLQQMGSFEYVKIKYYFQELDQRVEFLGLEGAAWRYAGICAAVGIVTLFLACLVYRRRNLETAGDFISLKPVAPLFILVATIGAGGILYMFSDLVGNQTYLFLALGMAIGYFVGKMLLDRTLKVFGKKSLLTLGILIAVFGGSLLVTHLDPLGIVTYIPKAESVEVAYITGADRGYYYLADYSLFTYMGDEDTSGMEITAEEDLTQLQDFHRQLTRYRPSESDGVLCALRIDYKLKNGRTVTRHYQVGRDTALGQRAGKYFSDMRYIFRVKDTSVLYNDVFESVSVDLYQGEKAYDFKLTDSQEIAGLLDAIAADCKADKMAQNWAYHEEFTKDNAKLLAEGSLQFSVKDDAFEQQLWDVSRIHLQVYSDSTNTINYMMAMQQLHQKDQLPEDMPILDPLPE